MMPLVAALAGRLPAGRVAAVLVPDDERCPAALALVSEPEPGRGAASVALLPAGDGPGHPFVDRHLRVDAAAPHPWPAVADVVTGRGEPGRLAGRYPGALVTASPEHAACLVRHGCPEPVRLRVVAAEPFWPMWGSVLHAWLAAGLPVAALASATGYALRQAAAGAARAQSVLLRPQAVPGGA
ncbi:hypothetical protein [Streptomyces marincola]|uniref:hypothetical protein n=1 Tax=Streptomyces marincola TaxID=2878388 RepID=UPI001CF3593C|nr:hypothetical protein [Streptomyces marincola]UCM88296.1 hypothetical protein LC193_10180 [Streptomyces marincola]